MVASDLADSPDSMTYVSIERVTDDQVSGTAAWVTTATLVASSGSSESSSEIAPLPTSTSYERSASGTVTRSIATPPW